MTKIRMTKDFTMPLDEIHEGIEKLGVALKENYGFEYKWEGKDRIEFKNKGAKGYIEIQGITIKLSIKLGMMYMAMAPMIKTKLEEFVNENIS